MIIKFEVEIEVPEATECPVHQATIEKLIGRVTKQAVKDTFRKGARLLLVDSYAFNG